MPMETPCRRITGQHGRRQRAFTLVEALAAVAVIGVLVAMVVMKIVNHPGEVRRAQAQQEIQTIVQALERYRADNGRYPSQAQGLQALVTKPVIAAPLPAPLPGSAPRSTPAGWKKGRYLERLPIDPWGRPYLYRYPGVHGAIDVYSYGTDGGPNRQGPDASIGSWQ